MKLHRKIKHSEKVCRAQDLSSYAQGQRSKSCLSNNSNTVEANLTKLHRKIELNAKFCRAQGLVYYPKVKVTIRSEVKLHLKSSLKNN